MTDDDTSAELRVESGTDSLTISIPLGPGASGPWVRRYLALARKQGVPAEVREEPANTFVVVRLPAGAGRDEVFQILDAARDLVEQAAETETSQTAALDATEAHVREWWHQRRP